LAGCLGQSGAGKGGEHGGCHETSEYCTVTHGFLLLLGYVRGAPGGAPEFRNSRAKQ
jgi:hypothetical protein